MAKYSHLQKAAKAGGAKDSSTVAMKVLHDKAKAVAGGPQDQQAADEKRIQLSYLSWRPDRRIQPIQARQKPTVGPIEG
jgi:hypothetical protein